MASSTVVGDVSDLINCEICWCQFDENVRKPKFLPCAHTVCLTCLKIQEIFQDGKIACPICHKNFVNPDPASLPNNSYALYMLKLKGCKAKTSGTTSSPPGVNWCVTCGSVLTDKCISSKHPTINLTSGTIKNVNSFFGLRQEFKRLKEIQAKKLAMCIAKRKDMAEDFACYMGLALALKSELENQQAENHQHLQQLISLLEENSSTIVMTLNGSHPEKRDFFMPELTSLGEEPISGDTSDILLSKMKGSVEVCQEKLQLATLAAAEHELCKEMKIKIHLYDEDDRPIPCHWLNQGFHSSFGRKLGRRVTNVKQDLYLLSHVVSSILNRLKIQLVVEEEHRESEPGSTSTEDSPEETAFATESILAEMPVTQKFVLGKSIFILWLMQSEEPVGAICIRPAPGFRPDFMQKLGDFCYLSPKHFPNKIVKASSNKYAFLPVIHPDFKSLFIGMAESQPDSEKATQVNQVGINFVTTFDNRNIVGWSFTFILENKNNDSRMPSSELFGCFTNYQALQKMFSSKTNVDYALSIESK